MGRADVEKAKSSKEDKNKVVAKASENAASLLGPSRYVVKLLSVLGVFYPPCKLVSIALAVSVSSWLSDPQISHPLIVQALIKLEVNRKEKDVRLLIIHFDLVCHSSGRCSCHLVLT